MDPENREGLNVDPADLPAEALLNPEVALRLAELSALRNEITAAIGGVSHYVVPSDAYNPSNQPHAASHDNNIIDLPDDDAMDAPTNAESSVRGKSLVAYDNDSEESEESDTSSSSEEESSDDSSSVASAALAEAEADLADDDDGPAPSGPLRTAHEEPMSKLPLPLLPYLLTLPHQHLEPIGKIMHVYRTGRWDDDTAAKPATADVEESKPETTASEQSGVLTVVIQGTPDSRPMDEGTLLALADGRVFGCVEDVFGPVAAPCYLLRIQVRSRYSQEDIDSYRAEQMAGNLNHHSTTVPFLREADVKAGAQLSAVKEAAKYIYPEQLRAAFPKGSDASNFWDEEVPADDQEYSDDDEERKAAERRKTAKRARPEGGAKGELHAVQAFIDGKVPRGSRKRAGDVPSVSSSAPVVAPPAGPAVPMFPFAMPVPAPLLSTPVAGATEPSSHPAALSFSAAMQLQLQWQHQMQMQMHMLQQAQQMHPKR